jgi:hypothetical protein
MKTTVRFIPQLRLLLLAAICALLSAVSVRAQSPVMKLAMLRPDDMLVRRIQSTAEHLTLAAPAPVANQLESVTSEGLSLLAGQQFVQSIRTIQEWRRDAPVVNSLSLSRMSLRDLGRPNVWASFEAGYGLLFGDRSPLLYGHNGSCHEEPSRGYFRICFSF